MFWKDAANYFHCTASSYNFVFLSKEVSELKKRKVYQVFNLLVAMKTNKMKIITTRRQHHTELLRSWPTSPIVGTAKVDPLPLGGQAPRGPGGCPPSPRGGTWGEGYLPPENTGKSGLWSRYNKPNFWEKLQKVKFLPFLPPLEKGAKKWVFSEIPENAKSAKICTFFTPPRKSRFFHFFVHFAKRAVCYSY